MSVRLLVTGDIHIGRRPTRVPEDLAARASAARMWDRIVERAIDEHVDAVLLSGDIVDDKKNYYEATGPLETGIIGLSEEGIDTYAVAGNHDWDVFPRILKELAPQQRFHFMGQRGRWQEEYLERDGRRVLRIVGWSFPEQYWPRSPLDDFRLLRDPGLPTVGLLHAEVCQSDSQSQYAPVRLSDLQASGFSMWVLGHIHKPQHWPLESGTHVLNPGSPQALDPKEPGQHGPWLVELNGQKVVECKQLPMSLVRYEERDVDLAEAHNEDHFERRVNNAVLEALDEVISKGHSPELLSLRLNLKGASELCGCVDSLARKLTDLYRNPTGVPVRIDGYKNLTRPADDLAQLSQQKDLLGILAGTLLALEGTKPDDSAEELLRDSVEELLRDVAGCLQEVYRARAYRELAGRDPPFSEAKAREILLQQGWQLLEALRSQESRRQETGK